MPYSTQKLSSISVFFPCYNEEDNLPKLLDQALKIVPKYAEKYEIIVINDGSTDTTENVANSYASKYSEIRVISQENQGYGGAVNTGLRAAKYDWVFFTDADLQFNLEDLSMFVQKSLEGKDDLIIGYRKNRAEGFRRSVMANGMKLWNRFWLGFPANIKDIDCAFKLIKRDVVLSTLPLQSRGNLVSTEFLLKAYKSGFKMAQIGVTHYPRQAGKSNCGGLKDVLKVITETYMLLVALRNPVISGILSSSKYAYKLK